MNSRGGMFVERAKLAESVKARAVAIVPSRLQRVSADVAEAAEFETVRTVADERAVHVSQNVGLAAARGARAGAPELFQIDVAFLPVAPGDRQFLTNDFNAGGVEWGRNGHKKKLATVMERRYNINS